MSWRHGTCLCCGCDSCVMSPTLRIVIDNIEISSSPCADTFDEETNAGGNCVETSLFECDPIQGVYTDPPVRNWQWQSGTPFDPCSGGCEIDLINFQIRRLWTDSNCDTPDGWGWFLSMTGPGAPGVNAEANAKFLVPIDPCNPPDVLHTFTTESCDGGATITMDVTISVP